MNRDICSIVLLAVMCLVSHVLCCSKLEPGARAAETGHDYETDDRKVYYSDVVVFGEVVRTVEGNYPFKGIDGVYTVEFNVLCTYKGGPLPKTIYIAGLGNENGQIKGCPAVNVRKTEMLMFLKPTNLLDIFEIEFSPTFGNREAIVDDLTITCGLELTDVRDEVCYEPVPEVGGYCIRWTPIEPKVTKKPLPEAEVTQKPKEVDFKPGSTEDDYIITTATDGNSNRSDNGYKTEPEVDRKVAPAYNTTNIDGNGSATISSNRNENGQLPGCPAVPLGGLTQTKKVIMFLKPSKTKNVYEIEFKPNKADAGFAEDILEELSITCGLSLENDGDEICSNYEPLNEKDGCVTWTPVTPLPTPEPEKPTTPEPKETPKSESGDGKPEPTEKAVVDLDGDNKGKDNQSDEGYNTKPGEDSASAEGSKDNGNGSKVVAASILATILSIILTIVF